jgi:UDP-N-acetylglucosamine 2-epimerase (non-hydrolysing)
MTAFKKILLCFGTRPEGVAAGFSKLVGTDKNNIVHAVEEVLDHFSGFGQQHNPYGKGEAAQRIVEYLVESRSSTSSD